MSQSVGPDRGITDGRDMDEEMGSGGVEKEENGHMWEQEIRPTVFTAGWLTLFSLSDTCQDKKHTAVSYLVTWYGGGGGIGGHRG